MKNYCLKNITEQEKSELKNKIFSSITTYKRKKKINFYKRLLQTAAVIALVFGVSIFYLSPKSKGTELEKLLTAKASKELKTGDVSLLVNGKEKLKISHNFPSIKHSAQGSVVIETKENKKTVSEHLSSSDYNEVVVPYGKRTQLVLSEGTKVWLNAGSRMVYPAVFKDNKREIYLEGEAIFEVTHKPEKPFFVQVKDYRVKVLGTVFNISSYPDDNFVSTALQSGKVLISCKGKNVFNKLSTSITKGTLAVYDRQSKTLKTKKSNIKSFMSWRNGYLEIKNEKLESILKKLTRFYKVELILENKEFKQTTFSGNLHLKEGNLERVLEVICATSKVSYQKHATDNKIIVKW
ncbi:MAG: FecR family protein [Tenacibaculum sp.]